MEDAPSVDVLGLAPSHGHCRLEMPGGKGKSVLSFAPISQDPASDKRGARRRAAGMGGTGRRFGLCTHHWALEKLPSRASASAERQHLLKHQQTAIGETFQ